MPLRLPITIRGSLFPVYPPNLIGPSPDSRLQYSPTAPLATFSSLLRLRTDICNTTNMSTSTQSEPLPLPLAPKAITDDSELLKIWSSIDGWYSRIKEATDKKHCNVAWNSYGCHILLGCKVMTERLQPLAKKQHAEDKRSELGFTMATLKRIRQVHNWVEAIGSVHEDFRWETKTVIEVAQQKALAVQNKVLGQVTRLPVRPSKLPISIETIQDCERVLYIVMLYTAPRKSVPGLDRKASHDRWEYIDSLLQDQQKLAAAKDQSSSKQSPLSNLQQLDSSLTEMAAASFDDDLAHPAAKRQRISDQEFTASQGAIGNPVAPPVFDAAVMFNKLQVNTAKSRLVALFERPIAVETPGILDAPAIPSIEDMAALLGSQWISDRVIVCYLALVCHQANGHFSLPDPCATQDGTPKYHAWDSLTLDRLKKGNSLGRVWPPHGYPEARLEDVEVQFFPWHMEGNHWCLGVLSKVEKSWVLNQYSTIPGYETSMQVSWVELRGYLESKSGGAINALTTEIRYPLTPQQNNSDDSGPLILCIARWLMEGWPLVYIKLCDIPEHRTRIAIELEGWRLSGGSLSP